MKTIHKTLVISIALIAASAAQALMINGNVAFVGRVGLYDTSTTATMANADGAASWNSFRIPGFTSIEEADGSYTGLAGGQAEITAPWSFNSGPINNFWSIYGFTFNLISSSIAHQSAEGIVVKGNGTITADGFEDTPADWYFSTQGTPNTNGRYSFSSSTNVTHSVPDSSSTLALLGLGLLGLGVTRRHSR